MSFCPALLGLLRYFAIGSSLGLNYSFALTKVGSIRIILDSLLRKLLIEFPVMCYRFTLMAEKLIGLSQVAVCSSSKGV